MKPSDQARWQGTVDSWLAQGNNDGILSTPADASVIADSGQLIAGWYDFKVLLTANCDHYRGLVTHRNAANSATLHTWHFMWSAYTNDMIIIDNWRMLVDERMRVVVAAVPSGVIGATVYWVRKA